MKAILLVLGFVLVSGQKLQPNRQVPYPAVLLASNANFQQREAASQASQDFSANSQQSQSFSVTTTNVQENRESQSSQSETSAQAVFSQAGTVQAQQTESESSFTNQNIATQFEQVNEQSQSAANIQQQANQETLFTSTQKKQQVVLSPEEQRLLLRQAEGPYPKDGVFEPLNLPAGAFLLMRQIDTTFECGNKPYGFYADESNDCRVFHVCNPYLYEDGRIESVQYSFMCNEYTVFDQKTLTCMDRYEASPCQEASFSYSRNEEFGLPEEKA